MDINVYILCVGEKRGTQVPTPGTGNAQQRNFSRIPGLNLNEALN